MFLKVTLPIQAIGNRYEIPSSKRLLWAFLLGFAPFVPHSAKLRLRASPSAQDDAWKVVQRDFASDRRSPLPANGFMRLLL